jgi:SAM-dependent methyltransferase
LFNHPLPDVFPIALSAFANPSRARGGIAGERNKQSGRYEMSYRYDGRFYDANIRMNAPSAAKVVDVLLLAWPIKSVLDVGCALGSWLCEWAEAGIEDFHGVDGLHADDSRLLIDRAHFTSADLGAGFDLGRQFDLVQSLEVAEHLPSGTSAAFVASLVRHSRGLVLFSAAPPGQGGENHINEQSYDFCRGYFRDWGYYAIDWIRPRLKGDKTISYWYRYNLILYASAPMLERLPDEVHYSKLPEDELIPDVSPRLFQARKQLMRALPQSLVLALVRIKAQFYSR